MSAWANFVSPPTPTTGAIASGAVIRIVIVTAALTQSSGALDSQTLTCSTWQQITTCQGPGGYVSHELHWQDRTIGDDNQGDRWSTSRWNGIDITTVEPSPER
jgi:hypothetical protein